MKETTRRFSIDVRSFLTITVLFSSLAGFGLYAMYKTDASALERSRKLSERMHNEVNSRTIDMNLKDLFIELQVFAKHVAVRNFLKNKGSESRRNIEEEALNLSKISKMYDQIRLLGNNGMELLRVNYNNGSPAAVPPNALQDKSSRYYFQEALRLSLGEIYVSPFDLNIENGRIEQPLKPMIRACTPVYGDSGERLGIVVFNYLGQRILDDLGNDEEGPFHIMLLNKDGYWLLAPHKNLEWTFMYEDKKSISFASTYPEAWAKITAAAKGQFTSPAGDFTFSTIRVSPGPELQTNANSHEWKLVSLTPQSASKTASAIMVRNYLGIFTGIFFLILFGAMTRARFVRSNETAKKRLERARQEAENANKAKSDFLAKMSHEIRTPMNAVIGLTHLALKTKLSAKQSDYLNKISLSAHALLAIINDILDFSKIEADRMEIDSIEFNLDDVLNNTTNMLGLQAEQKGLEFLLLVKSCVPSLLIGDPLRLGQVLLNLAGNAIKFTESGEVIIAVELMEEGQDKATIRFSIQDSGIGISKEQIGGLFQPFSQADGTITRKFGGTGLGLTISKRLIELMGGRMHLESEPDKGSTFSFTIPFTIQPERMNEYLVYPDDIRGMRVLVVDDNKPSRLILCKILKSFSFDVVDANGGEQALQLLTANDAASPFRLVITDWKMPGINGFELTKRIKENAVLQHKPKIILLTAYSYEEVRHQAGQIELDGFMLKPFNRSILFDTIMDIFGSDEYKSKRMRVSAPSKTLPPNCIGARVLLVEDNFINQQVAREILEDAELKVSIANNGQEALEMLENNDYDAVLMDIQMPVMDGFQAIKAIRAHQDLKDIPVIAMTAHALVGDKEKSLLAGMNDHVTKPIDPDVLIDVLSTWLPQKGTPQESPYARPPQPSPPDSDFPSLPGIDTQQGLARVRGNTELYTTLLVSFAKSGMEAHARLFAARSDKAYGQARSTAHSLKGVAGNIGAEKLHHLLKEMENAFKQETDASPQIADAFEAEFTLVTDGILNAFPQAPDNTELDQSIDVEKAKALRPELEHLASLLKEHDVEARDFFKNLKPILEETAPACTAELGALINNFDFSEARQRIELFFQQCQRME